MKALTAPPRLAGRLRPGRPAAVALIAACLFAVFPPPARSEGEADPQTLEVQAAQAEANGDYGGAAILLRKARTLWPSNPRFPLLLGDLYTGRGLHSLALDEYLAAERLVPGDIETLQSIADGYGFLNRSEDSIRYLRRILEFDPDNPGAVGDLGWMLFKTHRIHEGIALLEKSERRLGADMEFSMTLGTLWSELFDYGESKRRYEEAIAASRDEGYSRFASVAYYNVSLLESRFRFWDRALAAANDSILMEARPSGYLARGELRLKRMELGLVQDDFKSAYALDTTPLARLSLADAAWVSGRLDEALVWVREISALEEHPWMANFGTDPENFALDLHELFWKIYRSRADLERIRPKNGVKDALQSLLQRTADRLQAAYHERLFRKASRLVAASYEKEGAELPAAAHGFSAFRPYLHLARRYLRKARSLETVLVPGSEASYDLEEALLMRDAKGLSSVLERLDPIWERDLEAEALEEIARLSKRPSEKARLRSALERLWLINPGALPRTGFSVPAIVTLESASGAPVPADLIRRLRRLGMGASGDRDDAFDFALDLRLDPGGLEYALRERASGVILRKGSLAFGAAGGSDAEAAEFLFRSLHERNP